MFSTSFCFLFLRVSDCYEICFSQDPHFPEDTILIQSFTQNTGGALNPARSFGPAAVSHTFATSHWIYWVGPFIGALLAVGLYWLFKFLQYELANPGQDGDVENDPTQNPRHALAQSAYGVPTGVGERHVTENEGGFNTMKDGGGHDRVMGQPADRVLGGDEVHVKNVRSGEPGLESQPAPGRRFD